MDDAERPALGIALAMGVVEPFANPGCDEGRHGGRHGLPQAAKPILDLEQILAPDIFHCDKVALADTAELENLADVGVRELAGDLGLIDEHLDEFLVLGHRRQDAFDGENLLEPLDAEGFRLEDLGHAADAQALEKEILPEGNGRPHSPERILIGVGDPGQQSNSTPIGGEKPWAKNPSSLPSRSRTASAPSLRAVRSVAFGNTTTRRPGRTRRPPPARRRWPGWRRAARAPRRSPQTCDPAARRS